MPFEASLRRYLCDVMNNPPSITHCPHQDRCRIKPDSKLKDYLENECKGFVKDPQDRYTINYVIIVLIADFEDKELFCPINTHIVLCTPVLQNIFGKSRLDLSLFRNLVREHFFHLEHTHSVNKWMHEYIETPNTAYCLILCPFGYSRIFYKILDRYCKEIRFFTLLQCLCPRTNAEAAIVLKDLKEVLGHDFV